jgi:hypothetical protein
MIPIILIGAAYLIGKSIESDKFAKGGKVKLTPEQYKLVHTLAFQDWFGNSEITNADKEPLTVYHFTNKDFNIFDLSKARTSGFSNLGFWFGSDKNKSKFYGRKEKKCYLKIENGYYVNDWNDFEKHIDIYSKTFGNEANDFREYLILKGYDGVIIENADIDGVGEQTIYIVFKPTQIKLADGTNTTFDSNNPDIRYDEGGNIKQKEEDIFKDIFSYKYNGFYSVFNESDLQSIIDFLLGVMLRTNSGLGEGIGKKTLRNLFFKTPQSFRELYEVKPSRNLWRGDTIFPTKKNRKSDFYLQSYSNKSTASFFGNVIWSSTAIESYGGSFSASKYNDTLKSTDYWFLKAATFYLMSKKNKEMYSELFTMQQFFSIFYILNGKGLIGRKYQNWLNKKWLRGKGINFNVDEYEYGNEIEIGDDEGEVMFFDVIYNYPLLKSIEKKYS